MGKGSVPACTQSPLLNSVGGHRCPTGYHRQPSASCYKNSTHGCRCYRCCLLAGLTNHRDQIRSCDPQPTRERLTALLNVGWSKQELADESGLSLGAIKRICAGHRRRILLRTEQTIRELYERADIPTRIGSRAARREDIAFLESLGCDETEIAARVGLSLVALDRRKYRRTG